MITRWKNELRLDEAGASAGGGASGGSGSTLTTSDGGSGSAAAAGKPDPAMGAADGGKPAGASGDANPAKGLDPSDWRSVLPKELQEDATLKKYTSVHALAGAYVNAQKLIGADKIPVPGKGATEEDWQNVFKKLGLPEDASKYDVKFKEGISIDDKFAKEFKDLAYKQGILPQQAQKLADWFSGINENAEKTILAERETTIKQNLETLRKEWGNGYDLNLARGRRVVKELGDDKLVQFLEASGAGDDPAIIKLFAKVGETLWKEDKIINGGASVGKGITPAEAKTEANKIMGDKTHPYHIKEHPGHNAAVRDVQELFQAMAPRG
jgi:hypothetical protein